ncbi:MAG: hypothetical protein E7578_04450 [Ruminococcaceae bacterium]|nr:hypothetical protein [Oscillospiraceae bacterium]
MATKYVENYRFNDMNDTETIQAAIEVLKDGDTLVFNKTSDRDPITDEDIPSTTYVLDAPVDFTRFNVGDDETPVIVNKTRKHLTINGNGCTITNSSSFTGYTDTYTKNDGSFVSSMIGSYIRLKCTYGQSALSGQKYISFTVV